MTWVLSAKVAHALTVFGVSVETLEMLLLLLQISFLSAAVPFAVDAVRAHRGSPWGDVLRPLPVVALAFLCSAMVTSLPVSGLRVAALASALWGVATLGIVWSAVNATLLLTERRTL